MRSNLWIVALSLLLLSVAVGAERQEMTLRITCDPSGTINRERLLKVKQFLIKGGQRATYCNKYCNNPTYGTSNFHFFLDPDTGQQNIQCDLEKSDFNTLTIQKVVAGANPYRSVDFFHPFQIAIEVAWPSDDLTVLEVLQFVEEALLEIENDIHLSGHRCAPRKSQ